MAKKKVGVKLKDSNEPRRLAKNEIIALAFYALWTCTFAWVGNNNTSNPGIGFIGFYLIFFIFIPSTIIAFLVTLIVQFVTKKFYIMSLWLYVSIGAILIYLFYFVDARTSRHNESLPLCLFIIAFLLYFAIRPLLQRKK